MDNNPLFVIARYVRAIVPVYLFAAVATAVVGIAVVACIAQPLLMVVFGIGLALGMLSHHFEQRITSAASDVRSSYARNSHHII
jgi:hypothetical protein